MARVGYTKEKKIEIIEYVINERKKSNVPVKKLCDDCGIATVTLYNWLKADDLVHYKEKLNEAVNYMDLHDTTDVKVAAKKGLQFLIKKSIQKKITYYYDYFPILDKNEKPILDKDGNEKLREVLKSKKIEKIDVVPDAKLVQFAMTKLFPQFEDSNKIETMIENFMEFNTFLKNIDPQLAKQFVFYQNNYMASVVKEIEAEEIKDNDGTK